MSILSFVHAVLEDRDLSAAEAESAMSLMLEGAASPVELASFLTVLRMKGETADELTGFARAMRRFAEPFPYERAAGEVLLDTCGTGGGGPATFNVSTIAAFVVAACGVKVAKHGNRSITSKCGSADLLEAMGIHIDRSPEDAARAVREIGIAFLFAPSYHGATRHVQPVRKELKFRTVFNLLGPLVNPAGANVQVVGTTSAWNAELLAEALCALGIERGFVVHGMDGMDEVSTTGETLLFEVHEGKLRRALVVPKDFGLQRAELEELAGGGPEVNAGIARRVLGGERGAARDIVLANAGLALYAAGKAQGLVEGVKLAGAAIDSGDAAKVVERMRLHA